MKISHKRKIDNSESDARCADYWDELQELSKMHRSNPVVQRRHRVEMLKYWMVAASFSVFIGPIAVISLYCYMINMNFFEVIETHVAQLIWPALSVIGLPMTMLFIPRKEDLWWRMAMDDIKNADVPVKHKAF